MEATIPLNLLLHLRNGWIWGSFWGRIIVMGALGETFGNLANFAQRC